VQNTARNKDSTKDRMMSKGYLDNTLGTMRMLSEAQAVIGYRLLGMAGSWPTAPSEVWRMTFEKVPAFTAAWMAASLALATGSSPDRIMAAWLKPIGAKTRANSNRLSRRR
jgi:hypothetical protein